MFLAYQMVAESHNEILFLKYWLKLSLNTIFPENPTTASQSEHSNPASPTPQNPVTVSSENPTSPSGGQNDSSTTPGSPTGEESSTPQPSSGTDQPEGSTQYYLSTVSALLPTTTSSPCAGALCSIQQVLQQLAAQLMAFLQEIFGPLLEALGITNIG